MAAFVANGRKGSTSLIKGFAYLGVFFFLIWLVLKFVM